MLTRLSLGLVLLSAILSWHDSEASQYGRTSGSFSVAASGSANYSIPIRNPPGVAGLQPALALSYNSQSGDGLLGVGWGLVGLSAISRCNLTYAQDGIAGSPQLTSSDRFCLDGNRLRTTNGSTYGAAGATYQTEIANFSNVTSNGTAGSGPAWFTVKGKDGLTYEYGNTLDSAILSTGSSSVRVWALNAVRDRNGNSMTLTYTNDTTNGSYRPASIQYTNTGGSTTNSGYSIVFTYQSRSSADQIWTYTIGGQNNQLNYLSAVTVNTVSGSTVTMVHGYVLTYATAPTSSRFRLASIQECASSTTDCFPATSIGYQDGQAGWGSEIANSGNATNMGYAMPMDVNGDGIDDLVYPDTASGHWYYELGTASGTYAGPYDTGMASTNYTAALAIDFYVNGRKEILVPNSSNNWRVLQFVSAGAAFSYVDTSTSAAGAGSATVGDIDGDGREDLIYAVSGGTGFAQSDYIYYRLNSGGGFSTTQNTLLALTNGVGCTPCVKLGNGSPFGNPTYRFTSQLRKLDFNGDGRADFLVNLATCQDTPGTCGTANNPLVYTWTVLLSQPNGSYVAADAIHWLTGAPGQAPLIADFNGDGCSDVALTVNGVWNIYFGTCGRSGSTTVLGPLVNTNIVSTGTTALAIDWDGDGRADLIQPATGSNPDWLVARSLGNTLSAFVDTGDPTSGTTVAKVADVNGDGQQDLTYMVANSLKTRLHNGAGAPPDLVTSITDGYGNAVTPTYMTVTQVSTVWGDQVFPYENYTGPLYIAVNATFNDPSSSSGGTYYQHFYYAGAALNLQGRGFAGFGAQQRFDSRNGVWETWNRSRAFPTTGMVTYDVAAQDSLNATPINTVTNTLASSTFDVTANNQRYFPYVSNAIERAYEVEGAKNGQLITTTSTSYTFDGYGNATTIATTMTDSDSGSPYYNEQWTSTLANTVSPDASTNWCLNMPTEQDVTNTAPGVSSITRHVAYTPDYSHCRQTQRVIEPSSGTYAVAIAYSYDSFGNPNGQTVTGVGMAARTTGVNWGTSGQFPTTVTNALSQSTHSTFDTATGMQLSQTDPNGIATSWQYDSFGRKNKEIRPDGTSTTWTYAACSGCDSLARLAVTAQVWDTTSHPISTSNDDYDMLDRPIYEAKTLLSGAMAWTSVHLYDSAGRVQTERFPYLTTSSTPGVQTYTYDLLNRVTSIQRPISATNGTLQTTNIAYQGRTTTVTDPQGKITTIISQVTGVRGSTRDHNGYAITFNRDAFGSVLSVTDSLSNTLKSTTYGYGLEAFPTSSTDMDLGARSYKFDALGELSATSDAKSQSMTMAYDVLSRSLTRSEPEGTTTWTWGNSAASFNIGRLQSVTSPGYAESESYDSDGRLTTTSITSDATYRYDFTYNGTTGLLDTLTYPTSTSSYRLKLQYLYANGIPQQIKDANASTVFWQANGTNPRGQITQETVGNGVVTNRVYDAVTGWVSSIQSGIGSGASIQNESYLFDMMGNLIQRQNNNAGLTENFFYDALYRLDHSTLGSTTNLQMAYDAMGNITSRSDVASGGTWTYDTNKKHAVLQTGSGGYAYTYDANGNASSRNGYTVAWTSYNYPSSINANSKTVALNYAANRQRYQQIYSSGGTIETTMYVGGLLEKVTLGSVVDWRHYIRAGNELIAVMSRQSSGTNVTHYVLSDHQGSMSELTDAAGATTVGESFSAFGTRRNPSTWSGLPSCPDLGTIKSISREGYTGQDAIGGVSMGLNHMNGRVQDAITGRFLSADPAGETQSNPQSWNRYSYVNNNPLSRIDPSGFADSRYLAPGEFLVGLDSLPEQIATGVRDTGWTRGLDAAFSAGPGSGPGSGHGNGGDTGALPEVIVVGHRLPPVTFSTNIALDPWFFSVASPVGSLDGPQSQRPVPSALCSNSSINAIAGAAGGAVGGALTGASAGPAGVIGGFIIGGAFGGAVGYLATASGGASAATAAGSISGVSGDLPSGAPISNAFGGALGGSISYELSAAGAPDLFAGPFGAAIGGATGSAAASFFAGASGTSIAMNAARGAQYGIAGATVTVIVAAALQSACN